jgi:ribosomal RNA small subunit methyltransferase A
MAAMTGKEIREVLDQARVLPSKQMGQNFLIDPNMARWIVAQLDVSEDDAVCEVGPGTGALSVHLVGKVRRLILIEFDARLAAALKERYKDEPSVEVHHADGAKFDGRTLFKHRKLKFLGNLPYSCGGAIMKNLLSRPHPFERAVIMLQKEVITRLAAQPGTKDYGILSLRTQANWEVEPLRTVPPDAFYPKPTIDSAVAVLRPRVAGLPPFDYRLFDELIRRGFAQRRKQLKKQLPEEPAWEEVCNLLSLPATVRGEELTLTQWVDLARAYDPHQATRNDAPRRSRSISPAPTIPIPSRISRKRRTKSLMSSMKTTKSSAKPPARKSMRKNSSTALSTSSFLTNVAISSSRNARSSKMPAPAFGIPASLATLMPGKTTPPQPSASWRRKWASFARASLRKSREFPHVQAPVGSM